MEEVIELEEKIIKMQEERFIKIYGRVTQAKKESK